MSTDLESVIAAELQPREKLLWSGRPAQGIRLRKADTLLIPFSLLWTGFAVFWEWEALGRSHDSFAPIWGIPFVLIGLYLVFGRFIVDSWRRSRTYYGLTRERALIISGGETQTFPLRTLSGLSIRQGGGRYGTLRLGEAAKPGMEFFAGSSWPGMGRYSPPAFEFIEDARQVHELILSAQRQ